MTDNNTKTKNLAQALAAAQAQMEPARRSGEADAGSYQYTYSTLGDIIQAVKTPLLDNGIAFSQICEPGEPASVRVITVLLHEGGETLQSTLDMPCPTTNPQEVGKALSYARRYGLQSICAISNDAEDDDAASLSDQPMYEPDDSALEEHPIELMYLRAKAEELFGARGPEVLEALALKVFNVPDADCGKIKLRLLPAAIRRLREKHAAEAAG